jgi:hypothetical protein
MKMRLRSLYIDDETDDLLGFRAVDEGITKSELMRRFLKDGLARPSTSAATLIAKTEAAGRAAKADAARTAKPAKPAPKEKPVEVPRQRRAVASNRR